MEEQLIETWAIHNWIHLYLLYLLEALSDEAFDATFAPRGRTVYALFAHNLVRLVGMGRPLNVTSRPTFAPPAR